MATRRAAAVVLAAGESSRMAGSFKLLRRISGEPLIRFAVSAAMRAGLDPILVVVGHRSGEVRETLADLPVRILENPDYREGIGTSVRAAIETVGEDSLVEAVVILLGDEPEITPETILRVLHEWREARAPVIRVEYRDRPGHPVLVDRACFGALEGLKGDRGLCDRLSASGEAVQRVSVDEDAPIDVDTEAAFRDVVARLQQ